MILDGKQAALNIKAQLKNEFSHLTKKACLAIIHYDDLASQSYLKGRLKMAEELNVMVKVFEIKEDMSQDNLFDLIHRLNQDKNIHGIMIDRPLPKKFDELKILSSIDPNKDVDGYTPYNLGLLMSNQNGYLSCTPGGAIRLLDYYHIDLKGKNALVIGRSINVGKPLALLLLNKNATVTIAHSKTVNLKEKCLNADIIFLAIGKAHFLTKEMVNHHTIIIDIGINFDENGKLCGDVAKECYDFVKDYSPVPGGVGVMTNIVLMENLLLAYKKYELRN